jgi:hypothetical protein
MRLQRILVGTTLIAVVGPVAAAEAADFGGGTPVDSLRRAQRQFTLVGLRPGASGKVRVWLRVAARCGEAGITGRVQINPDGTFALAGTTRGSIGNGVRRTARFRMSGRALGTAASGRASVRLTFRRHGRVTARCRSGGRTWQARVASPQPTHAPPRANGAYYGLTTQGVGRPFPFVVKVGPSGRRVQTATFDYRQRCKRRVFEFDNVTPGARIAADGTFRLRERFTIHYADGNERYRVAVTGQFTTSGVTGTLSVKSVLRSRAGSHRVLDRCSTGSVSFAAAL